MLLSCIGQRSLSNSGVLESLLNLLDSLLLPLQQPQAAAQARAEGPGASGIIITGPPDHKRGGFIPRFSVSQVFWTSP